MPDPLHIRHRQEGRHPPCRLRRQAARPRRRGLRPGEAPARVKPVAVGPDAVVSLRIEMYDAQGALLQASSEPVTYLHGSYGGLLEALEAALEGKHPGESIKVQLEPEIGRASCRERV